MDILTFISSLLGSLAWPLTISFLVFLFRGTIRQILDSVRLKSIKRGDTQIEFEQKISRIRENVSQANLAMQGSLTAVKKVRQPKLPQDMFENEIQVISEINPAAGVALAWSHIEKELVAVASKQNPTNFNPRTRQRELIIKLKESGAINEIQYETLIGLRDLRNKAVHEMAQSGLSLADAKEYAYVANSVVTILKSIK
jgi:hypothetical protein